MFDGAQLSHGTNIAKAPRRAQKKRATHTRTYTLTRTRTPTHAGTIHPRFRQREHRRAHTRTHGNLSSVIVGDLLAGNLPGTPPGCASQEHTCGYTNADILHTSKRFLGLLISAKCAALKTYEIPLEILMFVVTGVAGESEKLTFPVGIQ